MKKEKVTGLAEDVMKVDHALVASLKGVRALATRLHQESGSANEREQYEKILARSVSVVQKTPAQPKRQTVPDLDFPLRKYRKIFSALSEGQLQLILDLARSMTKRHRREERLTDGKVDRQEKNETGTENRK